MFSLCLVKDKQLGNFNVDYEIEKPDPVEGVPAHNKRVGSR